MKPVFRGFIAPTFAPYNANNELNLSVIPRYAKYLSEKNVKGVLVNGTVGEGIQMSIDERKALLETWMKEAKNTGLYVMVHVGGTYLNGVIELTEHAEAVGASCILCFPDLIFRPQSENELVQYLKLVGQAAPNTPLFYYNYPAFTGVRLDMVKLLELGSQQIPTLSGLKFTDIDLEASFRCVQMENKKFVIYLGCDQLILPALSMGFDSFILTMLNFFAEDIFQIEEKINKNYDLYGARKIQSRLSDLATFIIKYYNWTGGFKQLVETALGSNIGNPRLPVKSLSEADKQKLHSYVKKLGWN